ncbi:hypothetical protein STEG23_007445, partial [Scotinomys teguina]
MTVMPLGRDQDCSLKNREPESLMCRLSWFLDPGGWSKTAVVGLYFIFPGIYTMSLVPRYPIMQNTFGSTPKILIILNNPRPFKSIKSKSHLAREISTKDGMGNLRITEKGLKLEGDSEFLQPLYAKEIQSRPTNDLEKSTVQSITVNQVVSGIEKHMGKMSNGL